LDVLRTDADTETLRSINVRSDAINAGAPSVGIGQARLRGMNVRFVKKADAQVEI
jgi:hypothetical protein